ncbi:MAG: radical SAM protein [Zetaproteobacteria bacterium CG12_big_fil_rev_8_21_14_0_65_55_1124]|nr:MAG: radical SAM protein [Zetaproteobacteria bacterium CG1_02_55_237]PIS18783.1 MAG: radical SAM protein [Zetaproteobacteria bacterium CG08_land_8_20_14_0_20_55_17]PIW43900.1 MAG: radical SAM protein [Zetaproteobacteria bacterium CG12_big_fil_rev_8_21_14_0_65_55_1124]PIY54464.1 MAG: radical SAM protein [Zetaproteobacteria bacterium CG_4_10_14_0_8_um_filter_55_43]PIZ38218.1 MAG: radical SAM protein [Zetaproteobacteria bacterium CG_4_10_14_0_2_um_filter_55_20]PJB82370.1 MAG: radical SAM prote
MSDSKQAMLSTSNHDRDAAGMTYVYPVVSRRAGGVSVGVNLNPNNACNWHCAYCQVPQLVRGSAPEVDIFQLNSELESFIHVLTHGDFMQEHVPEDCRTIADVAISGNGEPTSSRQFEQVVACIVSRLRQAELLDRINIVLITNGSYVHRPEVKRGLDLMAKHRGQVWFKLDAGTDDAIARINGVNLTVERQMQQLEAVAGLCPTWIQTCMFAWDAKEPAEEEIAAYLDFLNEAKSRGIRLEGVLLYGLARPSLQAEAIHLSKLPDAWMQSICTRIESLGISARLSL